MEVALECIISFQRRQFQCLLLSTVKQCLYASSPPRFYLVYRDWWRTKEIPPSHSIMSPTSNDISSFQVAIIISGFLSSMASCCPWDGGYASLCPVFWPRLCGAEGSRRLKDVWTCVQEEMCAYVRRLRREIYDVIQATSRDSPWHQVRT